MAKYVLKDAFLEIDGDDVSNRVRGLSVTMTADDVDSSTMGDGVHQHIGGLRSDNYEVTFANRVDVFVRLAISGFPTPLVLRVRMQRSLWTVQSINER